MKDEQKKELIDDVIAYAIASGKLAKKKNDDKETFNFNYKKKCEELNDTAKDIILTIARLEGKDLHWFCGHLANTFEIEWAIPKELRDVE